MEGFIRRIFSRINAMAHCKNCRTQFDGGFCPNCGQKDIDLERPMSSLVGDVLKETIDLDGRASHTIRALFLRPGFLTNEFLAGRRRMYTPPLRLYLVLSVTFFVLVAWLAGQGVLLDPSQATAADAASQEQFLSNDLPRMMFVLLPIFALLMKVVFFRRLYFDHIIFSIHLHSAAYVVLALMLPIEELANDYIFLMIAQVILLFGFIAYFIVAVRRVYEAGWVVSILKSLLVLFGYMVVVSVAIERSSSFLIIAD